MLSTDCPSPWSHFRSAPLVSPNSDSPECFSRIREWIENCEKNHPKCSMKDATPLPARVVNIGRTAQGYKPFLYESSGDTASYAALSYVWGADLPLRTTKSTIARHRKKIKWSLIPKTIQDAIVITDQLGLEYLWVDSLTIIQDDPVDWQRESGKMAGIYSNAYITIAATAAKGCRSGIFASRSADVVSVWPLDGVDHDPKQVQEKPGPILARPTRYTGI